MSAHRPPRTPRPAEPPTVARPRGPVPPPAYREPLPSAYGERIPPTDGEPLPPEDPWWERGWMSEALVALAALIAGFVVGLLVGESSSTKTPSTGAAAPAHTVTVKGSTHTTTVNHVIVHTQTVTTAAPTSGAEGSSGGGRTYTGSGNGSLGTITVSRQSML